MRTVHRTRHTYRKRNTLPAVVQYALATVYHVRAAMAAPSADWHNYHLWFALSYAKSAACALALAWTSGRTHRWHVIPYHAPKHATRRHRERKLARA